MGGFARNARSRLAALARRVLAPAVTPIRRGTPHVLRGGWMLARHIVLGLLCVLITVAAGTARAGTVDGYEWPPDPKRYEPAGTEVAPGLKIGDTLASGNADKARDLLPPEVLSDYQKDEYQNPVVSWPTGIIHWDHSFEDATKQNAGKYGLSPEGSIIDKSTGKPPEYVYGIPFPTIAPDDPQAGLKAVWNAFHNYWNTGSYNFNALIIWAGR